MSKSAPMSIAIGSRKFRQQAESLIFMIEAAQKAARWEKNTVITGKDGQLESVGGQVKPKDPPAFRILNDEEMTAFRQGRVKKIADLDKLRNSEKPEPGSAVRSFKESFDAAEKALEESFGKAKDFIGEKFTDIWTNPDVVKMRGEIGDLIKSAGSQAKKTYTEIMSGFSKSVTDFMQSEEGKAIKTKSKEMQDDYNNSELGKNINGKIKIAQDLIKSAKEAIDKATPEMRSSVTSGAAAAIATISGMITAISSGDLDVGEMAASVKSKLMKMVADLRKKAAIDPEVARKMEVSIKDIGSGFKKENEELS